ncbi:MAG TPA: DNA cytosine methyltransferase, partial [Lacipirellulaceae bacterium]|nr:DNA cytosine methyltransferase [Lacipirellulaceae bacterium]
SFVVDAGWFVPQSRARLFVVGYAPELWGPPLVVRSEVQELDDPWRRAVDRAARLRPARLRAAIDAVDLPTGWATVDCGSPRPQQLPLAEFLDCDEQLPWWSDAETARHAAMISPRHRRQLDTLAAASASPALLTGFRRIRQGEQRLEVRFDGVAGCLRTPRGGSAKQVVLAVDGPRLRMRWMTPREYARLQGAPDYVLPDNAIQGYFGFGDAVCVPVIQWIDRHMLTPVFEAAADASRPIHAR